MPATPAAIGSRLPTIRPPAQRELSCRLAAAFRRPPRGARRAHRSGVWRYHELSIPDLPESRDRQHAGREHEPLSIRGATGGERHGRRRLKHEGRTRRCRSRIAGMTSGVSFAGTSAARRRLRLDRRHLGDRSPLRGAGAGMGAGRSARGKVSLEQLSQPIAAGCRTLASHRFRRLHAHPATRWLPATALSAELHQPRCAIEARNRSPLKWCSTLGWEPPDWVVVPVGNAGNISAIGKGRSRCRPSA